MYKILSSLLIGLIVCICALSFFKMVELVTSWWLPTLPNDLHFLQNTYSYKIGIALFVGAILAGQILKRLEENRPHSTAEIILANHQNEKPNIKNGFLTVLLALVSLSGGSSVGIFGPLVNLGAYISASLNHHFKYLNQGLMISIGAGAAISAIFSIPIGAAIFCQETLLRRFQKEDILPLLIGTFSSYVFSNIILGDHHIFLFHIYFQFSFLNMGLCILMGILCGGVVSLYMYLIPVMTQLASRLKVAVEFRPLVPALLLFVLSPVLPHLLGTGMESISLSLAGKLSLSLLIILCLSKIIISPFCLGFGFFGGVFGPALFIGAMLGGAIDNFVGNDGALFLVIGIASMIASTIGALFACIVIIFELTGNYQVTLLAILSVTIAYQISSRKIGKSMFDYQLMKRGIEIR